MLEIIDEELNIVNGGGMIKEMFGMRMNEGYKYSPGDKVKDAWHLENGVGIVVENVAFCHGLAIDQIYFPDVDQAYDYYENDLLPAQADDDTDI